MMNTFPETSHYDTAPPPVLLGILIDVSNSMRRNWRNKSGKKLPRIKVIKDALNKRIREEQRRTLSQEGKLDEIEVFCLGMGFKALSHFGDVDLSGEQEHSLGTQVQTRTMVDLTCDLLALSEILPSNEELSDFKQRLNQKWMLYTKEILDKAVITEDVYAQLVEYVQTALYQSAMEKLHQTPLYKLFHRFNSVFRRSKKIFQFLQETINNKEENIETISKVASADYAEDIFKRTRRDFKANQNKYVSIIRRHLDSFVRSYTTLALRALTLGFEITELVDDLDEKRLITLAKQIYAELDAEVRKHIRIALDFHQQKLFLSGYRIAASLDKRVVRHRTERFIQKTGWDILRPLIEDTVLTMFSEQFEMQAKKSFPYWVRLASMREVFRPLSQLSNLLPNVVEEHVYSDEVMFGSTPFKEALDKAAIRLIDKAYTDRRKVLIVISDGEFAEESSVMVSVNLLKRRGVTIITCLVADRNIISRLVKRSKESWPMGAKLMVEIASEAPQQDDVGTNSEREHVIPTLTDKKLCYQINHSRILEDVLDYIFDSYCNPEIG